MPRARTIVTITGLTRSFKHVMLQLVTHLSPGVAEWNLISSPFDIKSVQTKSSPANPFSKSNFFVDM